MKRRVIDEEEEWFAIDDAGIVGDRVQLPSPPVWRIISREVAAGARNPERIIRALGGRVKSETAPEIMCVFTMECCLAVMVGRDEVLDKTQIRVLHNGAWKTARLRYVGGARYARFGDTCVELTSKSWWYAYEPFVDPAQGAPSERRANIKLTGKAPTEAVVQARVLCSMSEAEAVSYLMRRLGGIRAIGDRMACLAVLAINEFQTDEEVITGQTIDRNHKGWNQHAAPIARRIISALQARRLLTRAEIDEAHEIVSVHASQLLKSKHLAEVLAFGCPNERIVEEDEEEESTLSDNDFISKDAVGSDNASEVYVTPYPNTNERWAATFGVTEYVFRFKDARMLNYTAYSLLRSLREELKNDINEIITQMQTMWEEVTESDVHIALSHLGSFVSKEGERINVLWDGSFYEGVVVVCEPGYVFVSYIDDNDRITLDGTQLLWHYVV